MAAASRVNPKTKSSPKIPFQTFGQCFFKSHCEQNYFEVWVQFSNIICGDDLSELCSSAITQLSFTDLAIREAMLAVGCLKTALDERHALLLGSKAAGTPAYDEAISRYIVALRSVVSSSLNRTTIRTVLLCCILFICFDILDGNRHAVHNHVFHGLRILQQFLYSLCPQAELAACPDSPDPFAVDGLIIQIFQRLTMISHSHLALQAQSLWQTTSSSRPTPKLPVARIPESFESLKDAARWLDTIYKGLLDATRAYQGDISGFATDEAWVNLRVGLLALLDAWENAFERTLQDARKRCHNNSGRFSHALLLRIQWIVAYTSVKASQCTDYEGLVTVESYFEEIIILADQLPRAYITKITPFTICSPVFALFLCGYKCRNPNIRADAERLLGTFNIQVDGLWDNRAALAIVQWGRELEDEYAPLFSSAADAWVTIRQRYVVFHNHEDKATVGSLRLRGVEWVMVQEIISW
ncbi:unnamed protein product [Fusarium venenatum]|uniref:C6 zinc finger domain protein n=2 Tax=Fusarium venenatum TaxID=56646 RepID=A0A2L2TWA9_9HYPO|nr:uncharacterized protein FVRRES_08823 [Fusarium venenatum]CEI68746.1 unnamed protein product [Fusarium venenatum]